MKRLFLISITLLLSITLSLPQVYAQKIVDQGGSGQFKAHAITESSLPDHTIYCPMDLASTVKDQGCLPVMVFANGACEDFNQPFERFLTDIASYGYVVIALGPLEMDRGERTVGKAPTSDIPKAIDWVLAENQNSESPYYQVIDPEYIALAGMSCGGAQIMACDRAAAGDKRIRHIRNIIAAHSFAHIVAYG